jgi:hypothetical protein
VHDPLEPVEPGRLARRCGCIQPAESLLAHARPEGTVADMQKLIDDDIRERLY